MIGYRLLKEVKKMIKEGTEESVSKEKVRNAVV